MAFAPSASKFLCFVFMRSRCWVPCRAVSCACVFFLREGRRGGEGGGCSISICTGVIFVFSHISHGRDSFFVCSVRDPARTLGSPPHIFFVWWPTYSAGASLMNHDLGVVAMSVQAQKERFFKVQITRAVLVELHS